jgi:hypothetical protein
VGLSYSSTLSSTSTLDECGWLTPRTCRFTLRKLTRYPFYRRLGGPQGRAGRVRKMSYSLGFFFVFSFTLFLLYSYLFVCPNCPEFCLCLQHKHPCYRRDITLGRPRCKYEDNIKMESEDEMGSITLSQDREK